MIKYFHGKYKKNTAYGFHTTNSPIVHDFSSCGDKPQYGDWVIKEIGNPETNEFSSYPYPITVTIEKGGYIYLEGDLFGECSQKRQTYSFTQTVQVGDIEEMIVQDGVWEIKNESDGTVGLYIYPYDEKVMYKLVKLG